MAFVTPTVVDRPKSVRNPCVIKVFGGVVLLSRFFLDFSVSVGAFVIGLSQISFFFSQYNAGNLSIFHKLLSKNTKCHLPRITRPTVENHRVSIVSVSKRH